MSIFGPLCSTVCFLQFFSSVLTFISHMPQEWAVHSHWELSTASLIGNLEDMIGACQICIQWTMSWRTSLLNNPSDFLYPFLGSTDLDASFLEDTKAMGGSDSLSVHIFIWSPGSQLYWESHSCVFADGEKCIQLPAENRVENCRVISPLILLI